MNVYFWIAPPQDYRHPVIVAEAHVQDGKVTWVKQSDFIDSWLEVPHHELGGKFDPANAEHWKLLPHLFNGTFHWVTSEENANPTDPTPA
jgi:hypothetical protein